MWRFISGETHRKQRKLLSPVFSTKNLRLVTPVFYDVAHRVSVSFHSVSSYKYVQVLTAYT